MEQSVVVEGLGFAHFLGHLDAVGRIVLGMLLLMSVPELLMALAPHPKSVSFPVLEATAFSIAAHGRIVAAGSSRSP